MDHLTTTEERQARWYCRTIWPRFIPVRIPKCRDDLSMMNPSQNQYVYGVPMHWLVQQEVRQQQQNEEDDQPPPDDSDEDDSNRIIMTYDMMKQCFDRHGFMVIAGVLDLDECRRSLDLATEWIQAATAAEVAAARGRTAPATAGTATKIAVGTLYDHHLESLVGDDDDDDDHADDTALLRLVRAVEGGILPFYGAGHCAFAWSIRSHPNVRHVFASLLGTDDLLASLDGIILWDDDDDDDTVDPSSPPSPLSSTSDFGWFHIDQNPIRKPNAASVQGLVNLVDVDESTGGNVLVLDSHELFPHHYTSGQDNESLFYTKRLEEIDGDDWMEIDPQDDLVLNPNKVVTICLRAGDMILWDSRIVHCSYPPSSVARRQQQQQRRSSRRRMEPPTTRTSLFRRAATLVSMMPRHAISTSTCEGRKRAVHDSRTLTHWVDKVSELGAEQRSGDDSTAQREQEMVSFIKHNYRGVLLGWDDLTPEQQRLVIGT